MSEQIGSGIEVCIVEDDEDLREEISLALRRMGFGVRALAGSRDLYLALLQAPCDVLVLDLNLPGEDGFTIIERLRGLLSAGILVLTARSGTDDLVRCLTSGADAYLVKPVDFRELAANIVSLSRRVREAHPSSAPAMPTVLTWQLAGDGWSLVGPQGRRVALTASERILLQLLFEQANTAVRRDVIISALGHQPDYYLDHRLDMLVSRLRRKVQEAVGTPLPLKAVRGVGFMLSPREH
ncbi:response regulator transcription factor [Pseudothauera nasutitermitis]|nr:response regulator transcription factor [Pseudothauera nasutitermitis]